MTERKIKMEQNTATTPAGSSSANELKNDKAAMTAANGVRSLSIHDAFTPDETSQTCVQPTQTLREVISQMRLVGSDAAFVCEDERVTGVFSERDFLTRVAVSDEDQDTLLSRPVSDFMHRPAATLDVEQTLGEAVTMLKEGRALHVALVKDGRFVGAISARDIIRFLAESRPQETMNLPPVAAQVMDTREGG